MKGRILIACEFSGRVRDAFTKKGYYAMSCDILPTESPGPHYHGDVLDIIDDGWDMMIAFPPCTHICTTGNRSFLNNPEKWQLRVDAMNFVWDIMNAPIKRICIENPKGVIVSHIKHPLFKKPQYIQPYHYGHTDSKMTGLWLKNLPNLKPVKIVEPKWKVASSGKRMSHTHWNSSSTGKPENAKLRATTYQGIADAFADHWAPDMNYLNPPTQLKMFTGGK